MVAWSANFPGTHDPGSAGRGQNRDLRPARGNAAIKRPQLYLPGYAQLRYQTNRLMFTTETRHPLGYRRTRRYIEFKVQNTPCSLCVLCASAVQKSLNQA